MFFLRWLQKCSQLCIVTLLVGVAVLCGVLAGSPRAAAQVRDDAAPPAAMPTPTSTSTPADAALSQASQVYLPLISYNGVRFPAARLAAPAVVQRSPAPGEEAALDSSIELMFDRPMDQAAVQASFALSPTVQGALSWPDARTLRFQPAQPLRRAATYEVLLAAAAAASDGTTLQDPLRFAFVTAGYLEVGQVVPAKNSLDVAPDSTITVMFNRPVVPLLVAEEQDTLPQPLSISPAVAGEGEWVNTSIYVFRPYEPLDPETSYTAAINASLSDLDGNPLQVGGQTGVPYTWQFTTARPEPVRVLGSSPLDATELVPIDSAVEVWFSHPVEPESARAAFRLRGPDGSRVSGQAQVVRDTLYFTPAQRLDFGGNYTIDVAAGVQALPNEQTGVQPRPSEDEYLAYFRAVPLPHIVGTAPADGTTDADPDSSFIIYFNAPIDPETVMPRLEMTPPLSPTQVHTSSHRVYNSTLGNGERFAFVLGFGAKPLTDYRVRVRPGIADPYGNTIAETLDVSFRTRDWPPFVEMLRPGDIASYDAAQPARVTLRSRGISGADLQLYRMPADDPASYVVPWNDFAPPAGSALLREWTQPLDTTSNDVVYTPVDLLASGEPLEPGPYLLRLERPDIPYTNWPDQHIRVVSNINLVLKASEREALVWATDLHSGEPVPGLALTFYEHDLYSNTAQNSTRLGQATTDAEGVARLALDRRSYDHILAVAAEPYAAVSSSWRSGIHPGDFGLPYDANLPEFAAHIYTERPLYRPGQEVFFKGIVRAEDDARFSLPTLDSVHVEIRDSAFSVVYDEQLTLNDNGTFDASLPLDEAAALGNYQLRLDAGGHTFYENFRVAEYRPPEFEVAISTPAEQVVRGSPIAATVEVDYFFGSPVVGAPVEWRLKATHHSAAPAAAGRYRFNDGAASSSDDWCGIWECWWLPPPEPELILSGSGSTNEDGKLTIALPRDLEWSDGTPMTRTVRLLLEADVTGADNQVVSGQQSIIRHSSGVALGLAAESYVGTVGAAQQVDIIALDSAGAALPQQDVSLELYHITWENTFVDDGVGLGYWQWNEQRTLLETRSLSTDASGQAVYSFTPQQSGSYRIVAHSQDSAGHPAHASTSVWVAGADAVSWRRSNHDRIDLVADATSYQPGDTAEILIPSPYDGPHWALITVERGGILSHEVRLLQGSSSVYALPITAEHAPNIFVSAVLFNPAQGDQPADYKVGVVPLNVALDAQSLNITITPAADEVQPAEQLSYDILVTDLLGNAVTAELALDLVDKAVLSLSPRPADALRQELYARRDLGVTTASGMAIRAQQADDPNDKDDRDRGGDEYEERPPEAAPTPTVGAPQPVEGDDGGGSSVPPAVRDNFADTAYWNPVVITDAEGRARVDVTLPDDATTWVMRGVGITVGTQVGEGLAETVATKPLLVRPVTPRFFVVGDSAELSANVSNRTDEALSVQVGLAAQGLSVSSALTQTVQLAPRSEAAVSWQVLVHDVEYVDLVFRAAGGQYQDASRPRLATGPAGTLPVYRYSAPEVVGTAGQLAGADARTEIIALPPRLDSASGELTINLEPSLAAGMRDGLAYLEHYPYECTEQIVSRFLPNVLTARALAQLGLSDPELEARLPGLVNTALQKLYARQHGNGGWGWWSDGASNAHISAYVVFGMLRAQEAGFTVRDDVLQRGLDYLAGQLMPNGQITDAWAANRQAWLLYVLAEAGRPDPARMAWLFEHRSDTSTPLASSARALLALALHQDNATDPRIQTLLADLSSSAILSATGAHWEEQTADRWSMQTDTRSTAIILTALARLDPGNALNPNVVRWLMVARSGGIWETTQETAWSLMALTDWMAQTGELQPGYVYAATLNDEQLAYERAQPQNVDEPLVLRVAVADLLRDTGNRLTIARSAGPGRLYYTAHLRAFLPVEAIEALDRGVIVRRRYTLASCTEGVACPEVTEAQLGDEIRVELSIVAPHDLYYLVLEDPLPAGAEVLQDDNQRNTFSGQRGWWWGWWWRWYNRSEFRDEKVVLFADQLAQGSYTYSYIMRATLPGEFHVIPTTASEMYFPEVHGRSDGQLLRITR